MRGLRRGQWVIEALCVALMCAAGCGDDGDEAPDASNAATGGATGATTGGTTATTGGATGGTTATTGGTAATTGGTTAPDDAIPYDTLSEYGFFEGPLHELRPTAGVVPYTVAAPLWADHAEKGRFLKLPPGAQATFAENGPWEWPLGTIFIKTFFVSLDRRDPGGAAQIIETRLLRLTEAGWESFIYVWNVEQTEAERTRLGERVELMVTDADGQEVEQLYLVPNTEECKSCHEIDDVLGVLGPTTPQLNRVIEVDGREVNQLAWWREQGLLANPPDDPAAQLALPRPFGDEGTLEARARAYLHGNCGHCHREGGGGGRSGLRLVWWEDRDSRVGICKSPVAAGAGSGGRVADIVPGHPEESILIYRMSSADPEIKMPELPNLLPDEQGVQLISDWIAAMEPEGCP